MTNYWLKTLFTSIIEKDKKTVQLCFSELDKIGVKWQTQNVVANMADLYKVTPETSYISDYCKRVLQSDTPHFEVVYACTNKLDQPNIFTL